MFCANQLCVCVKFSIFVCDAACVRQVWQAACSFNVIVRYSMATIDCVMVRRYQSPCGELLLGSFGGRLCLCNWAEELHPGRVESRLVRLLRVGFREAASEVADVAASQLDEYFGGRRRVFTVPLLLVGTAFQRSVWQQLLSVPYGHTVSYGELARSASRLKAVRAVANAIGANALSVLVPCHRVVGCDGGVTGYAGGVEAKRFLLGLERRAMP